MADTTPGPPPAQHPDVEKTLNSLIGHLLPYRSVTDPEVIGPCESIRSQCVTVGEFFARHVPPHAIADAVVAVRKLHDAQQAMISALVLNAPGES